MLQALIDGLILLVDPVRFAFLFLGVLMGMAVGAIPGLGGSVGMAILLPFIFGMEPAAALAMLVGLVAVNTTSDTIPAVIFAVPGTAASAATVVDGYPMCKKGEAARALGAGYMASVLGGIVGALFLTAAVPFARPLLRQFLSPEFFMLSLLGVAMVGALSGPKPLKGIIAGGVGLVFAAIGGAPGVGHYRFVFNQPYLYDGIPLLVVAMGVFALPEVADLFIKGTQIADVPKLGKGIIEGYKDVFRNWWLMLRCGAIGAFIGFIPGLGGTAANWMAYGHAASTVKNNYFGRGDVRGVIAPEAANNAKDGGAFIPTLIFGIPGSGGMAIFLVGLMIIGVNPGSDMVDPDKNLHLLYLMVWSLVIANIMAGALCSLLTRPIAYLSVTKVFYILPFILMAIMIGAYQSTRHWGDLIGLFIFGFLGWIMKRTGWPRPPLLVGFVLGSIADGFLWLTVLIFDYHWLWRPWVITIAIITIVSLYTLTRWQRPEAVEIPVEEVD